MTREIVTVEDLGAAIEKIRRAYARGYFAAGLKSLGFVRFGFHRREFDYGYEAEVSSVAGSTPVSASGRSIGDAFANLLDKLIRKSWKVRLEARAEDREAQREVEAEEEAGV